MSEQLLQEKYLLHFLTERPDGLRYNEVKANTVSKDLIVEEDLRPFLSNTERNKENYTKLLRTFRHDETVMCVPKRSSLSRCSPTPFFFLQGFLFGF